MRHRGHWLALALLLGYIVPASIVLSSAPERVAVPYATPAPTATPTPYRPWWYYSANWP